jgi:hypothetical protein
MMTPNQFRPRPPMPVGPQRPDLGGGMAPGSEMTRPIQRSFLQPQQTFARPFSQIGSPGLRSSSQFPPTF